MIYANLMLHASQEGQVVRSIPRPEDELGDTHAGKGKQ